MMVSPSAHILNVGHGNCCVVVDSDSAVVIDVGGRFAALEFLRERRIRRVNALVISHADVDHVLGATSLLLDTDIQVDRVFLNPDARDAEIWMDFRIAVDDARKRGTRVVTELNTNTSEALRFGTFSLNVAFPSPLETSGGVGSRIPGGRRVSANGLSAVVKVIGGEGQSVLLAGDIDEVGLTELLKGSPDLVADVLVYPHHGGSSGRGAAAVFSRDLISQVTPSLVVFSNGRGKFDLPRPDVVEAVRTAAAPHVMCTQLSRRCCASLPTVDVQGNARGEDKGCAGHINIELGGDSHLQPTLQLHRRFIDAHVVTPLCLGR